MTVELKTRLAVASDGERVSRVLDNLRREFNYTAQVTIPLPVHHDGPLYVILAEVGDAIAGIVAAQRCHNLVRGATFLLITDIYVLAEFRQQGIATRLMNEALALGRRIGCHRVSLIVEHIDNAALATASRAGFSKHNDILLQCPFNQSGT